MFLKNRVCTRSVPLNVPNTRSEAARPSRPKCACIVWLESRSSPHIVRAIRALSVSGVSPCHIEVSKVPVYSIAGVASAYGAATFSGSIHTLATGT